MNLHPKDGDGNDNTNSTFVLLDCAARTGVICEIPSTPGTVIPAKAGIHSASHWKYAADGLDSRLRGNDWCFERDPIPNDTTTAGRGFLLEGKEADPWPI